MRVLKNRLCIIVAGLVVGAGVVAAGPAAVAAPVAPPAALSTLPPGGTFVPVAPVRVLDTRLGGGRGTVATLPGNVPPQVPTANVAAVLLNVTVVDAVGPGYVDVEAAPNATSTSSNGNYVTGAPSSTLALVRPNRFYPISVFTSTNADVVVDLQGYVTTPAAATADTFTPVSPRRIADTRKGLGGLHAFGTGERQDLDVRGLGLLPDDATAVIANITEASASARTYLTAWSGTGTRPVVSTVNADRGTIVANRALIPLSSAGFAALFNNNGRTDVVVDVVGYISPSATGSYYTPIAPSRLTDATATQDVTVTPIVGPHPTDALLAPSTDDLLPTTAVWLTVVGDRPAGRGYVTARPGGTPAGSTSDLNTVSGRAVANAGPVKVGADGTVEITASSRTRIVADIGGWFQTVPAAAPAAGIWSSSEYPAYDTTPQLTSTLPTTLPAGFAHAVAGTSSGGASAETVAFAVQDGQVLQAVDYSVRPGAGAASSQGWRTPTRVGTLTGVTSLATAGDRSYAATYALLGDGTVQAFGANGVGQLGRTPTEFFTLPLSPTAVPLARPATVVGAAVNIGYAVLDDGSVVSWGQSRAQLGRTAGDQPWVPAPVTGLTAPIAIAGDANVTYAITATGSTVYWGRSANSAATTQLTPVAVGGACSVATALHVDLSGAWEVCADGTVVQLDDLGAAVSLDGGLLQGRTVSGLSGVTQLAAGSPRHLRALLLDGTVAVIPVTQTSSTRPTLQPRFRGVTGIAGSYGAQLTAVG